MQNLSEKINASLYLRRIQESKALSLDESISLEYLQEVVEQVRQYPREDLPDTEAVAAYLLDVKQRFALQWSCAALSGSVPFQDLGRLQSEFAGETINLALRAAWRSKDLKTVAKVLPPLQEEIPGLFVLGLGKLGGYDLNFSSDVDLIAYFDPETLPVPNTVGQGYVCNKVLQLMTRLLQPNNSVDFVWRVDWRLRPDASSSQLCMPAEVARDYYFFKALPWHRLALMKARVVAGDFSIGDEFMRQLRPFIWRQNLDFRALDELAHIKQRINLEHPGLRLQRTWRDPITDECAGFNVKLGSGGIREIEFLVNALQLLWGGKQYSLRCTNTLTALQGLVETGHFDASLAEQLASSYRYLRKLENALQMLANAQTHLLPTDALQQQNVLALTDCEDWQQLSEQVLVHRQFVNEEFSRFFRDDNEEPDAAVDIELPKEWVKQLNARGESILRNWRTGFVDYGVPNTLSQRLHKLSCNLLEMVYQSGVQPEQALVRVDDFFRSMPQTAQYFRLLQNSPELLNSIVPPLLHSPHMTTLLRQSPHIIDCFIDPQYGSVNATLDTNTQFIFLADDYGTRLERIRRFVNESLYQYYLCFMQGQLSVVEFQRRLTELAEHTLNCCLRIVQERLEMNELPITVLGLGKVAMNRMSPLSDLDLVFIFENNYSMDMAVKFVQRLQTTLTAQLSEGIAYELDTRLRPSGKSGPATVFVDSFQKHHKERAHNWEHIALVPSRIVAGDNEIGAQVMSIKTDLLTHARNHEQWQNDAQKMWQRIEENRIKQVEPGVFESKLRSGGLMQAEYLAACYVVCAMPQVKPADTSDFVSLVLQATQHLGIDLDLNGIIYFWSTLQIWERLLGLTGEPYEHMPAEYLGRMLQQLDCADIEELTEKAQAYEKLVADAMQDYFSQQLMNPSQLDDWQETAVDWQAIEASHK